MAGLKPLPTPMRQPLPPPVHAFGSASPPDRHPAQALNASSQPLRPPRRRSEHHMKERMGSGGERQGRRSIDVPNGRGQMGGHGGHHHHQHMNNEHARHAGRPGGMNAFEGARTPPSGKSMFAQLI